MAKIRESATEVAEEAVSEKLARLKNLKASAHADKRAWKRSAEKWKPLRGCLPGALRIGRYPHPAAVEPVAQREWAGVRARPPSGRAWH